MTRDFGPRSRLSTRQRKRSSYAGNTGNELIRHVEADRVDDDHRPVEIADRAQRDRRPDAPELRLELGERLLCHARTLLRHAAPLLAWRPWARRSTDGSSRWQAGPAISARPSSGDSPTRGRVLASAVVTRAGSTRSRPRSARRSRPTSSTSSIRPRRRRGRRISPRGTTAAWTGSSTSWAAGAAELRSRTRRSRTGTS